MAGVPSLHHTKFAVSKLGNPTAMRIVLGNQTRWTTTRCDLAVRGVLTEICRHTLRGPGLQCGWGLSSCLRSTSIVAFVRMLISLHLCRWLFYFI